MFSSRLPQMLHENAVTRLLARLRADGRSIVDLTETNPTQAGFAYPPDLHHALASPRALNYTPEPLGLSPARTAAASELRRQGVRVAADRVVLTASTSEAYSLLFKLLCDPGDSVLVPQPSYPLFDLLSRLDSVSTSPYLLHMHGGWMIDRASVLGAITPRTRAVLVVSPNNPTGSVIGEDDARWLDEECAMRGIAVIADEVFLDYSLTLRALQSVGSRPCHALTFVLGGLSKSAGLPQMKLGWMAVLGPDAVTQTAIERIEMIADTYLSVATPVQIAASSLIQAGAEIRATIHARVRANLAHCRALVAEHGHATMLEPEAGWCVVLRVPAVESEEAMVLRLLGDRGVLVHPGYFFDFPSEAFLVLSLLPPTDVFVDGLARVLRG